MHASARSRSFFGSLSARSTACALALLAVGGSLTLSALSGQEAKSGPAANASPTPSAPTAAALPPNMETFVLVLLVRPADAPTYDEAKLKQIQADHLANIKRLADEGKIVLAGPFEDHSGRNVRGMFLMKTDSVEQAREWTNSDPAVKAGRLKAEFLRWFTEKGRVKY